MPRRTIELYLTLPPGAVQTGLWRRRSLLLALAGVHVLAFLLWPAPERSKAPQTDSGRRITWLTLPQRQPERRPAPATPLAAAPKRPQTLSPAAIRDPEQARAPQAITLPTPAMQPAAPAPAPAAAAAADDPFAATPTRPAGDDLKQALRNSAGAADRQLRKESWNPRDKVIANSATALASGMGEAFRGNRGYSEENFTTPDGRTMTKVHAGGSVYCAAMQSNTLVGGRDVFRDGVKTEITNCPRYAK